VSDDALEIRGGASPAEIAAVIAAVATLRAQLDGPKPKPRSLWARPSRRIRPPLTPGPGAWRASALPR